MSAPTFPSYYILAKAIGDSMYLPKAIGKP